MCLYHVTVSTLHSADWNDDDENEDDSGSDAEGGDAVGLVSVAAAVRLWTPQERVRGRRVNLIRPELQWLWGLQTWTNMRKVATRDLSAKMLIILFFI